MISTLRYGLDSMLRFDPAAGIDLTECRVPRGEPLGDVASAVSQALAQPLGFPPMRQAVVPGDQVVLAVEADLPLEGEIIAAVIQNLLEWGIEPGDITVLHAKPAPTSGDAAPEAAVSEGNRPAVAYHNPNDRGGLAYLAATPSGGALYLNRLLCDADLVLPIGCAQSPASASESTGGDGLYPAFSDAKTLQQERDRRLPGVKSKKRSEPPVDEPPDVAWMLGVQCVVQVVPGAGDSVLAVLAGDPAAVNQQGRALSAEAWSFSVPQRASLVVAAVEGSAAMQTWDHVARAVSAAVEAVADDGAIAICCDLESDPGPGLQTLAQSEDRDAALRRIRKQHLPDAQVARQFARAFERAKIYLLSRLDESVVEDLGIAPVANEAEVIRLASRHKSCILLANAQHAVAAPGE